MSDKDEIMPVLAEVIAMLGDIKKAVNKPPVAPPTPQQQPQGEGSVRVLLEVQSQQLVNILGEKIERLETTVSRWQWLFPDIRGAVGEFYSKSVNVILTITLLLLIGLSGYAWHIYQERAEWEARAIDYQDNYFKWEYFSRNSPRVKWEEMSEAFAIGDSTNALKRWVIETQTKESKIEDAKLRKEQAEKDLKAAGQ